MRGVNRPVLNTPTMPRLPLAGVRHAGRDEEEDMDDLKLEEQQQTAVHGQYL